MASSLERLLLSQAVYETGNTDFEAVGAMLRGNPLLTASSPLHSPEACKSIYIDLMKELGHDASNGFAAGAKPKARVHQELSKVHFQTRIQELRSLIATEEAAFQKLFNEINEIKMGIWDERIRAEVALQEKARNKAKAEEAEGLSPVDETKEGGQQQDSSKGTRPPPSNTKKQPAKGSRRSTRNAPNDEEQSEDPAPMEVDTTVEDDPLDPQEEAEKASAPRSRRASDRKRRRGTTDSDKAPSPAPSSHKRTKTEDPEVSPRPPTPAGEPALKPPSELKTRPAPPEMDSATYKRWKTGIVLLLQQITNDQDASVFAAPVLKRDAPSYHKVILQPMDFKSVGKRVRDGTISSTVEFRRDVLLIFANAIMFNPPGSDVSRAAHRMLKVTEELIHLFEVSLDS